MKTVSFIFLFLVSGASFAAVESVRLFDGGGIPMEDVEAVHFFDDGSVDYLELVDGDTVEGADLEDEFIFSREGGVGGNRYAGGIGGGGHPRSDTEEDDIPESDGDRSASEGADGAGGSIHGVGGKGHLHARVGGVGGGPGHSILG